MEEDRVQILRSFSKVWKIERLLYHIGKVNLPNPVAIYTILYFIGFAAMMMFLGVFSFIRNLSVMYRFILIPGFLAWFFKNQKLDGKNPFSFFKSILVHYYTIKFKGSRISRFRYIKNQKKKVRFNGKTSFRELRKESL